jgi:copper chaperone CopZ
MNTLSKILFVVVFLITTNYVSANQPNPREAEVVFSVNMDCQACEQKVKKNIPFERGVIDLTTDLEKQLVTIKYRTNRTNVERLKKSIEKLKFTCTEVQQSRN